MKNFFIPLEVIASMGLRHDGETVSREVRISDLLADGTLSMNDYHALAAAGMVFIQSPLFTFQSVVETAEGWSCQFRFMSILEYLTVVFPGGMLQPLENGRVWQLWLPEPPTRGYYYNYILVKTQDVLKNKSYCGHHKGRIYGFDEGTVLIEDMTREWVPLNLYHREPNVRIKRSYFAQGGRYQIVLESLERCY